MEMRPIDSRVSAQVQELFGNIIFCFECPENTSPARNSSEAILAKLDAYFNGGRECVLTKNPRTIRICQFQAKVREYVDTATRIMAGVMLAATGIFHFMPELADKCFPWLAE